MSKSYGVKKEMLLSDVIKKSPESVSILLDHGIIGIGQHVASNNTIKDAAKIDFVSIYNLIYDLNQIIYADVSLYTLPTQTQKHKWR
ncbi:hypothetical protein HN695_02465 [Candidatus Woesearchaeota archaeon]|nr:hypothetical protein [Candidatus Woesearchaeota archaeon]MBT5272949.1 hypothetical protein [Candidatus Woesearchaeota archaeon]MBT6041415.1 hypothetical protein [Candidatus Woesearchaeota archaeon]MBT6337298.1 hypothetical protein [Candidatus Woesearchaeota archaeon]MBT7927175.1 hypothetical protein [Candidatus Woesearchaeota archaeon]